MQIQGRWLYITISVGGAGEMAQRFRAPVLFQTICNSSFMGSNTLFWPLQATGTHRVHRHTCKPNTHTHNLFFFSKVCILSLAQDPSLVPSNQVGQLSTSCSFRGSDALFWTLWVPTLRSTYLPYQIVYRNNAGVTPIKAAEDWCRNDKRPTEQDVQPGLSALRSLLS